MSLAIPRPALLLGLAGLIPFLYAAVAATEPRLELEFAPGYFVAENFGLVVFAYMCGAYWGFAVAGKRASGRAGWRWLGLAVAPAALAVLALVALPGDTLAILLWAFPLLLPVDWAFQRAKLAPGWWLPLRAVLTAVATGCLWLAAAGAGEAL